MLQGVGLEEGGSLKNLLVLRTVYPLGCFLIMEHTTWNTEFLASSTHFFRDPLKPLIGLWDSKWSPELTKRNGSEEVVELLKYLGLWLS